MNRAFKYSTLAIVINFSLMVSFGVFTGCGKDEFEKLKSLKKDDPERAGEIARRLKDATNGVFRALADMSCYGGGTRGMGSWMLINSTLTNLVHNSLDTVLASSTAPIQQRVEAAWIMWLRTKNIQYLDSLYLLVKSKGNLGVQPGRHYLKIAIKAETELDHVVDKPDTEDLSLSLEDFKISIRRPEVISDL